MSRGVAGNPTANMLPTGAATAALQVDGNASLASIDGKLVNTLPVSAASLPLPTGAATSANQTTGNSSLSTIAGAVNATAMTTKFADSISIDAFGRARVSEPLTLFDSKLLYDNAPLFYSDVAYSGAGTSSTYNTNQSSVTIGVSATTAGKRVRQTFQRFNYQPGKSQLLKQTFYCGPAVTGITMRAGYFDEQNGVGFAREGSVNNFFVRTYTTGSVATNLIPQNTWNVDRLDGSGGASNPSGLTLVPTNNMILFVDLQWLGVGRVRFGFVINGIPIYCHYASFSNTSAGVYMKSPNLPVRFDIEADGTNVSGSSLICICASLESEGGQEDTGASFGFDRGTTALAAANNNTTIYPLLAFRLKSAQVGASIQFQSISVMNTGINTAWKLSLLLNPTFAGTALTFNDIANSALQAAIPTNASTISAENTKLFSSYEQSNRSASSAGRAVPGVLRLGASAAASPVSDVFVLAIQNVVAASNDYYGSMNWLETV